MFHRTHQLSLDEILLKMCDAFYYAVHGCSNFFKICG